MKVIVFPNQKGGVGKTTTAVTVADLLMTGGLRVLLVDLDAQGNCADALGEVKGPGLYNWLVLNAFYEGLRASVRFDKSSGGRLDLMPSDKATVKAKKIIAGEAFSERILATALRAVQAVEGYDVVILDSAPGADVLQINALVAATHFLIPVSLAHLATVGAADVLGTVQSLKKVGAFQGQWLGILPTMWERTTNESHKQLVAMAERFKRLVWSPIPVDVRAREAPGQGKTLREYAPGTRALVGVEEKGRQVGGYRRVVARLVEEVGP